jgi:hypothetical protein
MAPRDDELLRRDLVGMVRESAHVMRVLQCVRALELPDPLLFSGAVYQTAWNALTGRDPAYGIKDYDVGYYDNDISFGSEDRVIAAVRSALDAPLRELVEVRNQARVHLWFPEKFGQLYPPLSSTADALTRFVCPAFAVGIRLERDDSITVEAPFGLWDVFEMRLRLNERRGLPLDWRGILDSLCRRWPELQVVQPGQDISSGGRRRPAGQQPAPSPGRGAPS